MLGGDCSYGVPLHVDGPDQRDGEGQPSTQAPQSEMFGRDCSSRVPLPVNGPAQRDGQGSGREGVGGGGSERVGGVDSKLVWGSISL